MAKKVGMNFALYWILIGKNAICLITKYKKIFNHKLQLELPFECIVWNAQFPYSHAQNTWFQSCAISSHHHSGGSVQLKWGLFFYYGRNQNFTKIHISILAETQKDQIWTWQKMKKNLVMEKYGWVVRKVLTDP